jgi:hypothetical protein
MALENPTSTCEHKFRASKDVRRTLSILIVERKVALNVNVREGYNIKKALKKEI